MPCCCLLISMFIWCSLFWHVARCSLVVVKNVSRLYVRPACKTPCSPKITTVAGQNWYHLTEPRSQKKAIYWTLEGRTDVNPGTSVIFGVLES